MKRNHIILGFATLLFAAGSAVASTQYLGSSVSEAHYLVDPEDPESECNPTALMPNCDISTNENCIENVPEASFQPKQLYADDQCSQPLERETGF